MSSSATFVGASFHLLSVTLLVTGKVRVRFTAVPKQASAIGANDGLNPANYSITGSHSVTILGVTTVGGDPDALDLTVTPAFAPGTWILTVANIQTASGTSLVAPFSLPFTTTDVGSGTALTAGAENDDPAQIIRKHLSAAMGGENWDALIAALGSGDDTNWDNARLVFDQLFKSSASGKYLDRIMANDGIRRPLNVGMSDDIFRDLGIKLTNNKLTHEALREILEIYYGRDALRAYAETELSSPYNLSDGLVLSWTIDENQDFEYTFDSDQFSFISTATAYEVASVLTKTMSDEGSDAFAAAVVDPTTGLSKVRIYSGSLGLKSFVRITGGTSQPVLRFPAHKEVYSGAVVTADAYSWVYTNPEQNVTKLSLTTAGQPPLGPDISSIEAGDYIVIGTGVGAVTPGTYPIRDVYYSWSGANLTQVIEIDEDLGVVASIIQNSEENYRFFTAQKQTILNGSRTVVVAQTQPDQVDIQIPATTQAVARTARTGSYPTGADSLSVDRYHKDNTGLLTFRMAAAMSPVPTAGQFITVDGAKAATSRPWVSFGVPGSYPAVATSDASFGTCWSATQIPEADVTNFPEATLLLNGDLLVTGGTMTLVGVSQSEQDVCNRYRPVSTTAVIDGSEAEGALRQTYQWIATAQMNQARFGHGISTLLDGRALVTGGKATAGDFVYDYVELYDPTADVWDVMPALTELRFDHVQLTANNGKVYVIGGATSPTVATDTVEIFDPATLTWSAGAPMDIIRNGHRGVVLDDGRIFVTGGGQLDMSGLSNINETFNVGGGTTDRTAFYDTATDTWTEGPRMRYTRHHHQMHLLPDGRVLVYGGWGRSLTDPLPVAGAPEYPNNGHRSTEVWDPTTNAWSMGGDTSQNYTDCTSIYLPGKRKIIATNSNYVYDFVTYGFGGGTLGDSVRMEIFDVDKKTWTWHHLVNHARREYGWHVGNDVALFSGGLTDDLTTYTTMDILVPGYDRISGGALNGAHKIVSATSTSITVQSNDDWFATNYGDADGIGGFWYVDPPFAPYGLGYSYMGYRLYNYTANGYKHVITSAIRTSNVTTLTLGSTAGLATGQHIYANVNHSSFPSGLKTLTAVTSTTISYAEVSANVGATAVNGYVGVNLNPLVTLTVDTAASGLGPYVFDPDAGLSITADSVDLQTALRKSQQVDRITVSSTADFPDEPGYIVFGYGTASQSRPVRYLEKIGTNILLLDFSYVVEHDYPVSTPVSLLDSREPFVPEEPSDSANFYATGSNAGRIAAQADTTSASALGITLNFDVVYPGDRGLGGEGYPTEGDGKLSDAVKVWGGDE